MARLRAIFALMTRSPAKSPDFPHHSHPGEFGYDTWPPEAWKYEAGPTRGARSPFDEKRGIAYFALGAPTYDFYGADRIGAPLSAIACSRSTPVPASDLWHYQLVHHDLWDYDPTTAPKLMTVRHSGNMVDIVAQPTKFGFLYVSIALRGSHSGPSKKGRFRRARRPVSSPGRHSRFPQSLLRSRARPSQSTTSTRSSMTPRSSASKSFWACAQ